jgi:MoaA/NifB/PqqE/SkfB family radical SAM enzyme
MSHNGMSLLPSNREYRQAIRRLIDAKAQGRRVGSSAHYLYHILTWPDFAKPQSDTPHRKLNCLAGQAFCNVDTDGTVYPCSLLIGSYPGVNFKDVGFKAAFEQCGQVTCKACVAACFTEYSKLFALNMRTVAEWTLAMFDSGERRNSALGKVSRKVLPILNGTAL